MVRGAGLDHSVLTTASQYSFSPSLRYYACLCGHEELVLYLLANGERRGGVCTHVCRQRRVHICRCP